MTDLPRRRTVRAPRGGCAPCKTERKARERLASPLFPAEFRCPHPGSGPVPAFPLRYVGDRHCGECSMLVAVEVTVEGPGTIGYRCGQWRAALDGPGRAFLVHSPLAIAAPPPPGRAGAVLHLGRDRGAGRAGGLAGRSVPGRQGHVRQPVVPVAAGSVSPHLGSPFAEGVTGPRRVFEASPGAHPGLAGNFTLLGRYVTRRAQGVSAGAEVAVSNRVFTIPARRDKVWYMYSNGNSFSNSQTERPAPACPREPWYIRLLSAIQDRGST